LMTRRAPSRASSSPIVSSKVKRSPSRACSSVQPQARRT